MEKQVLTVGTAQEGTRLDKAAAGMLGITRSAVQTWLEQGRIILNGAAADKKRLLQSGDVLEVTPPEPAPCAAVPQNIPLDIVYEDDELLVVNKPKGMVVHPAAGHTDGTLVNALLAYCGNSLSGINGVMRPGIVHRIDKDTSGLLIVAKNDHAHQHLARQIRDHSFTRKYEAVVCGHLKPETGTVEAPIGRHPIQRKKMAVTEKGSRPAVTHYEVIAYFPGYTHVRLRLETGRTHQIRVHMAWLGHPVAGDTVYGPPRGLRGLAGQCLHARLIGFCHPMDNRYLELSSPLPEYFIHFLQQLGGTESCRNP
ncbi:MAG: RluA family pseudouridine synthase [Clostridiales bacterium]|nr:RluA family pseudouridine synthase [Clostridiales bacterium]